MTFKHKLSKRLAISRPSMFAPLLLVLLGCSEGRTREFLSPAPGQPNNTLVTIAVSPRVASAKPGETISFSAKGTTVQGKTIPADVQWEASGGTIGADGRFTSDRHGLFSVRARSTTQAGLSDSASVAVFVSPKDILKVRLSPDSTELYEGDGLQLDATAQLADGTTVQSPPLDWSASGGNVDGSGWYSPAAEGTYTVSASAATGVIGEATVVVLRTRRELEGFEIAPRTATITVGTSRQFQMAARWSDGSTTPFLPYWSATGGTITPDGLFEAGSVAGNFKVIGFYKYGADTAFVSVIEPTISQLEISPSSVELAPAASQQYVATATMSDGSTRTVGVAWKVTGGTITAGGLYYAPNQKGTFKVIGSVAGTQLADTSAVTVTQTVAAQTQLILNPSTATVPVGTTRQFSVTAKYSDGTTSTPSVTWSATGGSITAGGLYAASAAAGTFKVIARDPASGKADTSAVTVTAAVLTQVALDPPAFSVRTGQGQQLSVTTKYSDGTSVAPGAGYDATAGSASTGSPAPGVTYKATGGTVSAAGLYLAGSTPGTYRVIAAGPGGTPADTSFATITAPAPVLSAVSLSPGSSNLRPGGSQQFTVRGTWSDGSTSVPAVAWEATGGTISSSGLYKAGSAEGSFRVIATQAGGTLADTSAVTVAAAAPVLQSLVLAPTTVSLQAGGTRQYSVSGTWSDGSTATPSVVYNATGGTVTNGGLYVAGSAAGTYQVVATQAGGSLADTSVVTITAAPTLTALNIAPGSAALAAGKSQQFSVTGTYSNGSKGSPTVTWKATGGSITKAGWYTAGNAAGAFLVIASCACGVADTAQLSLSAPDSQIVGISITPTSADLKTGEQFTFVAQGWVQGSNTPVTPSVTWSATGGTVDQNGVYKAGNTAGKFYVKAKSNTGSPADSAAVNIASVLERIELAPASVTLSSGKSQAFQVIGRMSDGSVSQVSVAFSASGGTVSGNVYTAGSEPGVFSVIGKETLTGKADTAKVTITSSTTATLKSIELTPASVTLEPGGSQTFQTVGQMSDGSTTSVSATYSPTGGTMSGSTYTAGSQSGTYRVIAAEAGGKADTSSVTIQAAAPPPPPPGGSDHPNEPAGHSRVAEHDFSSFPIPSTASAGNWFKFNPGQDPTGANLTIVTDNTAPVGDNSVLRTRWPIGLPGGTSPTNTGVDFAELSSIYVTFWVYMEPNAVNGLWEGNGTGIQKWSWLGSGYGTSGNMQTLALMGSGLRSQFSIQMRQQGPVSGAVNLVQNVPPYVVTGSSSPATGPIQIGRWQQIEYVATINTIGKDNGTLRIWIDGHKTHDYSNIRWRDATNSRGFYEWKWEPTFGGGGPAKTQDDYARIAKAYISGKPL